MKRLSIAAAFAALLLFSCTPQVYTVYLDVRQPSVSGLRLSGKTFAVAYFSEDSAKVASNASVLARTLQKDYFGGEPGGVKSLVTTKAPTDTTTLHTLRRLVMESGHDVVFLMNTEAEVSAWVYDSMGEDKALSVRSSDLVEFYNKFVSVWKPEGFSFYYFEDDYTWVQALELAGQGNFPEAQEKWIPLAKSKDSLKAACAAYNMAMSFYLMENTRMATQWLDAADRMENIGLSSGLRKRINANLEK